MPKVDHVMAATVSIALLFVLSHTALAQSELDECNGADMKASISACGSIIANAQSSSHLRSAAYRNRAIRLFATGRLKEALDDLNHDIGIDPKDAIGFTIRATVLQKFGKTTAAKADLDRALSIDPDLPQALTARSLIEYQSGDLDAAIADSSKAIDADSRQSAPYNNRGAAFRDKGEYDRAIADFNVVIRMSPEAARPLFNRGATYQRMGNKQLALKDFNAALAISPNDPDALAGRDSVGGTSKLPEKPNVGSQENKTAKVMDQPERSQRLADQMAQADAARQEILAMDYKKLNPGDLSRLDQLATKFPEVAFVAERIKSDYRTYQHNLHRGKTSGEIQFEEAKSTAEALIKKAKTEPLSPAESQQLSNAWFTYNAQASIPHYSNEGPPRTERDPDLENQYRVAMLAQTDMANAAKTREAQAVEEDQKFFAANIPQECKAFPKMEAFQRQQKEDSKFMKMVQLLRAGEQSDACSLQIEILTDVEGARAEIVSCYRAAGRMSEKSRKMKQLGESVMIYATQMNDLKSKLDHLGQQYHCD